MAKHEGPAGRGRWLPPVVAVAVLGADSDYWVGWASGQYGWLGGLALALLVALLATVGWFRRTLTVDAPSVKR